MRKGRALSIIGLCLAVSAIALAENPASSTETYLEDLHAQGIERVIVRFKAAIDTNLIDKYNGKIILTLQIINAVVCEIPQANIALLEQEEGIKSISIDAVMDIQPDEREIDLEWLSAFNRLEREYIKNLKKEYHAAKRQAHDELKLALDESKAYKDDRERYRASIEQAILDYHAKVAAAKDIYFIALDESEERVKQLMLLQYEGPVTLEWYHLEAGMNSKAAWDNYDLDGTGVKIAILDTGVQYTLPDLINNYLGGYDFVTNDPDPLPPSTSEYHGTEVAEVAVAEGVSQVVGVAYKAGFYAVRVGTMAGVLVSNAIAGIQWAMDPDGNPLTDDKADIINMSFAGYGSDPLKNDFEDTCNIAYSAGIILIAGSGNNGYNDSGYPASFANVISVGRHNESQAIPPGKSNGGVDVVAPGFAISVIDPDGSPWTVGGTSYSSPHACGLIALQLQHARQNNTDVNNGYLWGVIKHSAVDLGLDPVYQGEGKIWAAETNPPPPTPHDGAIDLMSSSIWPFSYTFDYLNEAYWTTIDGYYVPAFYIRRSMYQDTTLTNISDVSGNTPETITNLNVTTTQQYLYTGINLPGSPVEDFASYEPITLTPGSDIVLQDTYYIPSGTIPGLDKTVLELEFTLGSDPRILRITDNQASVWCPPEEINDFE